jgi:hypothetical protein
MKEPKMNAKPKRGRGGPHGTTKGKKVAVIVMLPPTTKEQLDTTAGQAGITRSAFVDQALQAKFKKEKRS